MQRCIELASLGVGYTAPNPMVGAVLVYENRIIGEGFHRQYGEAHAEVNCINSVSPDDEPLIPLATLYVSLEPCAHFGKTPPCADLIVRKKIPRVVIGCRDPFEQVNGRGIERLQQAGIEVTTGILKTGCIECNRRFFTWNRQRRPYVVLKWAQTADHRIAHDPAQFSGRLLITGQSTNREVHKWRSEEAAILVGANTALMDNPSLTNRYWTGRQPVRLVLDPSLRLPDSLQVFDDAARTIVLNLRKTESRGHIEYHRLAQGNDTISALLQACYELSLQSVLVEGGAKLLQSFIDAGLWDEARVITNTQLTTGAGLSSPVLREAIAVREEMIETDSIHYYKRVSA
ncbi:bifunctional diaminohydroxyphosphoribosylaminopyrimidine deaminase/5-amino-6-(5-phosphoribosylamino)uracil reductase RibD [Sediminibacterium sp. WSJ-3]|nr:bifunctional diaminohydroxyphosphoribosylaminopyrimidine deaminase/5-amino-6-(5-phosphoribosylamino)uracil reductase RibD [Sediminibacterium soli]